MYVNIKRNIKEDTHKTDKKVRGEKRKKTESDREQRETESQRGREKDLKQQYNEPIDGKAWG